MFYFQQTFKLLMDQHSSFKFCLETFIKPVQNDYYLKIRLILIPKVLPFYGFYLISGMFIQRLYSAD